MCFKKEKKCWATPERREEIRLQRYDSGGVGGWNLLAKSCRLLSKRKGMSKVTQVFSKVPHYHNFLDAATGNESLIKGVFMCKDAVFWSRPCENS